MRLVLIRHGESENNRLWAQTRAEAGRSPDPRLTDVGEEQARRLAKTALGLPWAVDAVYTSLMARAIQTAHPLADALDLPLRAHRELFEVFGPYDLDEAGERVAHPGSSRSVLASLSDRLELPVEATESGWWTEPLEVDVPATAARAARVVESVREAHGPEETVALVTHGFFTQFLICALLGIPEITGWFRIDNTGLSVFNDHEERDKVTAEHINWMPHLDDDLVTA
jgi:2,3-bisphosphoglycerate-dependent phosphoglycerate mutase